MESAPVLRAERLSHTFDGWGIATRALDHVSLSLRPGDWAMLVGPNGAGKSTLLGLLSGAVSWNGEGRMVVDGVNMKGLSTGRRGRLVFHVRQDPLAGTAPELTVAEHLALADFRGARMWRPLSKRAREKYAALLQPFGLADRLQQPVSTLSGGERQLLTLLMAQLREVKLLLVDEGLSSLDEGRARACMVPLRCMSEQGTAILMVTHNLHFACQEGNRLVVLRHGAITLDDDAERKRRWTPAELWEFLERGVSGGRERAEA